MRGLGQDYQEETSTSYSSVAYEEAPPPAPGAPAPDKSVVKGLQNAINRFYGVTIGSPISVDGVVGNETLAAVNSIIAWMPGAGYDAYTITQFTGDSPTIASIGAYADKISNSIDWIADNNSFTQDPATSTKPSVPAVQSGRGLAPSVAPATLPKGRSLAKATSFLGLGLPNWVFYGAGGALALGLVVLIIKRKRPARA